MMFANLQPTHKGRYGKMQPSKEGEIEGAAPSRRRRGKPPLRDTAARWSVVREVPAQRRAVLDGRKNGLPA